MEQERQLILDIINSWWPDYKDRYNRADDAYVLFHIDLKKLFINAAVEFKYNKENDNWEYTQKVEQE